MPEALFPLVTYCALMSATPGPNNVMLAASGANFGYRRTLPHMLGINAGAFVLTLVVCVGLGEVFARWPALHEALKVAGALYLVYLAWRLAMAKVGDGQGAGQPMSFLEGAAFQVVNPKSWMKAVTLATVFMPPAMGPVDGALWVAVVGWAVGFPLISVWTIFGVAIRRFLGTPWRLRLFNGGMAVSLVVLAIGLLR